MIQLALQETTAKEIWNKTFHISHQRFHLQTHLSLRVWQSTKCVSYIHGNFCLKTIKRAFQVLMPSLYGNKDARAHILPY